MQMAAIMVLPKPGKDPMLCSSYRPILLINIDAKLLMGILATRRGALMPVLIELDQSGCISTRNRSDNTKRILHLVDKMGRSRRGSVLLAIDAEKAFDCVHWPFLQLTMTRMGFSPHFTHSVFSGYCNPQASILINWTLSDPISIRRGTSGGW